MSDTETWFGADTATFGDRLAGAREAVGLDQKGLAGKLGVKTAVIQAWENDLKEPRANRLQMLAGLVGVSISWLLTGEGDGVDAPDGDQALDDDMLSLLTEMRSLRTQMLQSADRLARLEKRLRLALKD